MHGYAIPGLFPHRADKQNNRYVAESDGRVRCLLFESDKPEQIHLYLVDQDDKVWVWANNSCSEIEEEQVSGDCYRYYIRVEAGTLCPGSYWVYCDIIQPDGSCRLYSTKGKVVVVPMTPATRRVYSKFHPTRRKVQDRE